MFNAMQTTKWDVCSCPFIGNVLERSKSCSSDNNREGLETK